MSLPTLVTADSELLDLVLKLAAAADTEIHVSPYIEPEPWRTAPLVLVGEDQLANASARGLPRRSEVVVVGHRDPFQGDVDVPTTVWRDAVALGASHVVRLPDAERWLVDQLTDATEGPTTGGPVLTVLPAAGGAGASTLARALTQATAASLHIDLDPFGTAELLPSDGLRWPDLAATAGRIPPTSLRDALPVVGQSRYLGGMSDQVTVDSVHAVLEAGARGFPLTVVDAPRSRSAVARTAWAHSDAVVLVVGPDEHRLWRAEEVARAIREGGNRVIAVPRLGPGALLGWHLDLGDVLGVEVMPPVRHDRALSRGEALPPTTPRAMRATVEALLASLTAGRRRTRGAER